MTLMDDYIAGIEKNELPALRKQLAPLESGSMHIGGKKLGGPWVDETQEWIAHLKKTIGIYESIISRHRGQK
jgi:hypothetical protein